MTRDEFYSIVFEGKSTWWWTWEGLWNLIGLHVNKRCPPSCDCRSID